MKDKHKVLTDTVAHLFNTIGEKDILRNEKGKWYYEGRELLEEEMKALKEEAKILLNMRIWKVLDKELKYHANKAMFYDSKTVEDMMAGKMLIYYHDILRSRLENLIK